MLTAFQSRLVYFPTRAIDATPAHIGLPYEEVHLTTADAVRLHGWFVPAEAARGTVLFLHGNAGNISHRLHSLRFFHQLGYETLIIDYRGYGLSAGRPSEAGTYRDAQAAWHHLVEERGVPPDRIVLFGRSLGGAIAAWLATRVEPRAVILESTFTSIPDLAADLYRWLPVRALRPLIRLRYPTAEHVPAIRAPLLTVHSLQDELIPVRHGRRIHEAATPPKQYLEITGTHGDGFLTAGRTYEEGVAAFLAEWSR
jgi:uncharacterized protein